MRWGTLWPFLVLGVAFLFSGSDLLAQADGVPEAGNDYYRVFIEDDPSSGQLGTYTAGTGPLHKHPEQNILYGAFTPPGTPGTTYLTIRSYTTKTDYVTRGQGLPNSNFNVVDISQYGIVELFDNGFRTTWDLPGIPDFLKIVQEVFVEGSTIKDSRIRVTTRVTNTDNPGGAAVKIGIRYLWDLMIDNIDESWFRKLDPEDDWTQDFEKWVPPDFGRFETTNDPDNILFSIYGTVNNPYNLNPLPTKPDVFMYAAWLVAFDEAWDFTVGGTGGDSSVLYFWGEPEIKAPELEPGESTDVTAYLGTVDFDDDTTQVPALSVYGSLILVAILGLLMVFWRRGGA